MSQLKYDDPSDYSNRDSGSDSPGCGMGDGSFRLGGTGQLLFDLLQR